MSVSQMLFQLIIEPLEIMLEVIYEIAYKMTLNDGSAIVAMSVTLNLLLLPLYNNADKLQKEEKEKEASMQKWVEHIKKTFKGDERFLLLQTYYKQNNYKPIYSLRSTLPLLLQIPFFIAAYDFLSNLQKLENADFICFTNLSTPDELIVAFGVSINILPVVMTVLNVLSGTVYAKGFGKKEKIKLYVVAVVFLVLLYDKPAGLVLYWTINNLFSLVKNLIKTSNCEKKLTRIALSLLGGYVVINAFLNYTNNFTYEFAVILGFALQIPAIKPLTKNCVNKENIIENKTCDIKNFYLACIILAILTGILIPSSVIKSSPSEFIVDNIYVSPLKYVIMAGLLSVGTFLVWGSVFYFSVSSSTKYFSEAIFSFFSFIAVVDYMFFGTNLGNISPDLKYDLGLIFSDKEIIINLEIVLLILCLICIIWVKKRKILNLLLSIVIVSLISMSVVNIYDINMKLPRIKNMLENQNDEPAVINLSKNGKNVIVIMLDRAVSSYIPYIMQEKPELASQFDGFTWYPNTLSYGACTNIGSPALYGGYEYVPEEINKRVEESLEKKHNEALKIMPVIFDEAGYDVTVCDPPLAGYLRIPDLSIYDSYPQIKTYHTENGQFNKTKGKSEGRQLLWKRNLFCFGIMKICPLPFQKMIYREGTYCEPDMSRYYLWDVQRTDGISKAIGITQEFLDSFYALQSLPSITNIKEDENTFMMIHNKTAHDVVMLEEPEYEPDISIDNSEFDLQHMDRFVYNGRRIKVEEDYQMMHYQCNMTALIQLGKWFDYMRKQGVYDNTRIIIVSDHGFHLGQFDEFVLPYSDYTMTRYPQDIMLFNPLLLVKDFYGTGFDCNDEFMTNADVPSIATEGIIDDPINPFTGKKINNYLKQLPEQHVFLTDYWNIDENNGNVFKPGTWFAVSGKYVLDKNNWRLFEAQ